MDFETFIKNKTAPKASTKEETKVVKKRQRKHRVNRAFTYRGCVFYIHTVEGISQIYTKQDGTIELQATVPAEATLPACRELVKMQFAWKALKQYSMPKSRTTLLEKKDDSKSNA